MALSANLQDIVEYRGVTDLVFAEVLTDDDTNGYTTGAVYALAGVAEIAKATDSSNEAHYYNNQPAVVVSSTAADEVTLTVSAIPLDVLAAITGQNYDSDNSAYIEGIRTPKYFAIGYKTKKTNGNEIYVWRYKGMFNIPGETNSTENDGTDANGQEIVFTGIATTHKFTNNHNLGARAMYLDVQKNGTAAANFFDTVTTPDDLSGKTSYTLTITGTATDLSVTRAGVKLATGATIYAGDQLTISWEGSHTVTVNTNTWVSGDIKVVSGNVTVAIS